MKLMTCPINGPRAITEFVYGGELRSMPDPAQSDDRQWAEYLFHRDSRPKVRREWWCHAPSGVWFIAERDSGADIVIRTYLYDGGTSEVGA